MNVEGRFFHLPLDDDLIPQIGSGLDESVEESHGLDQEAKRRVRVIGDFSWAVRSAAAGADDQRLDPRRRGIDDSAQQFQPHLPDQKKRKISCPFLLNFLKSFLCLPILPCSSAAWSMTRTHASGRRAFCKAPSSAGPKRGK